MHVLHICHSLTQACTHRGKTHLSRRPIYWEICWQACMHAFKWRFVWCANAHRKEYCCLCASSFRQFPYTKKLGEHPSISQILEKQIFWLENQSRHVFGMKEVMYLCWASEIFWVGMFHRQESAQDDLLLFLAHRRRSEEANRFRLNHEHTVCRASFCIPVINKRVPYLCLTFASSFFELSDYILPYPLGSCCQCSSSSSHLGADSNSTCPRYCYNHEIPSSHNFGRYDTISSRRWRLKAWLSSTHSRHRAGAVLKSVKEISPNTLILFSGKEKRPETHKMLGYHEEILRIVKKTVSFSV